MHHIISHYRSDMKTSNLFLLISHGDLCDLCLWRWKCLIRGKGQLEKINPRFSSPRVEDICCLSGEASPVDILCMRQKLLHQTSWQTCVYCSALYVTPQSCNIQPSPKLDFGTRQHAQNCDNLLQNNRKKYNNTAESWKVSLWAPKLLLKCLSSFKLHYAQLHDAKIQAGSLVIWLKPCSSQSTGRESLAVRENENRAERAAGSLNLNLKSLKGCWGCLSQTAELSRTPGLSLAAGDRPNFIPLHRDCHILDSYLGSY